MIQSLLMNFQDATWIEKKKTVDFQSDNAQLVLLFGSKTKIDNQQLFPSLKEKFPNAAIVFSSTSGEIINTQVNDDSLVLAALQFEKTTLKVISTNILNHESNSFEAGAELFNQLDADNLASIFIFSDGILVNGGELVEGLNKNNTKGIIISGGLAGDGANFSSTLTGLNDTVKEGEIVAIGLYGSHLNIGHGSLGGWDEFGHEKTITKADKNVLYELDGKNALSLYKEYLGPYANELPSSALLFPLAIQTNENENLVRTILTIDEEKSSMTFAGNMPVGQKVRFMKANFDKLIQASELAAQTSVNISNVAKPDFALLVSCVGRKLVLQERIEEEVESAVEILGNQCATIGYYSYGEISPLNSTSKCELHNQTMTITTLSEI